MDIEMQAETAVQVRPMTGWFTSINATLSRISMMLAITGLLVLICVVFYQVFGRYALNSSPTWTENLAIVLVLYVTMLGAAVGVRDAGHISLESLLVMLSPKARHVLEIFIYASVGIFGVAMAYNGWVLGWSVANYSMPNLHVSEGVRYIPLVISGALIPLFCLEHIVAIIRGEEVTPSWN
ncbi:TRAP transporter small permease [Azospirillum sp. TSO22-1]|uniref:TRAP transporter small permease n=1 Tax=Azospirillum sp. TSO22-1 TaxID=716789 RepID=UPI000D60D48D|nr:TRAP transporter small permease [Azospirillum sp. TSO22-1]PWC55259.1 C4-dicarboxylate ABC transporter permease [Azospirillum sp. TSO22-1]